MAARVLCRAEEILGGREKMARHLRVSAALLTLWAGGVEPPPTTYFLQAVDVIEAARLDELKQGHLK